MMKSDSDGDREKKISGNSQFVWRWNSCHRNSPKMNPNFCILFPVLPHSRFPSSKLGDIDEKQCNRINSDNCNLLPESQNCSRGIGLYVQCKAAADNVELEYFFKIIQKINASRALEVKLFGQRQFSQKTFDPIKDVLIILIISNFEDFTFSSLQDLQLPFLTHLGVSKSENVEIRNGDLLVFPKLTMVVLFRVTVKRIEENAFSTLTLLRQLVLDGGYDKVKPFTEEQKSHLQLLHCSCEYDWLRTLLKNNPAFIAPRLAGQVHTFGGILSNAFTLRETFLPVDCTSEDLRGDVHQTEFSVNVPQCVWSFAVICSWTALLTKIEDWKYSLV